MTIIKPEDITQDFVQTYAPVLCKFLKYSEVIKNLQEGNSLAEELDGIRNGLLDDIEKEAKQRQELVEKDLESIQDRAYQKGLDQARKHSWEQLKQEFLEFDAFVEATRQNLAVAQEKLIEEFKQEIVRLAIAIAEKVTLNQLKGDDELFLNMIGKVLKETKEKRELTLQVNSEDYEVVAKGIARIQEHLDVVPEMEIKKNNAIKKRGVFVEMKSGFVDAEVEKQINKIAKALLNEQN